MSSIIFDFDGTIADSFDYVVDFFVNESGRTLDAQDRQSLRGMSMREMAQKLNFHIWQAPRLFLRGRRKMSHQIKNIPPIKSMPEIIRKLHSEGHELFIVSTNSPKNIRKFLEHYDLSQYFVEIYGGVGIFGKSGALKRLFRKQNVDIGDAWHIADEVRDVNASNSINLKIIAVTWGFARPANLQASRPTAIAHSPDDIITILEEN